MRDLQYEFARLANDTIAIQVKRVYFREVSILFQSPHDMYQLLGANNNDYNALIVEQRGYTVDLYLLLPENNGSKSWR